MPKVELHRHLELTLRLSTLRELARAAKLEAPDSDDGMRAQYCITSPMTDLASALRKFLDTQKVLNSEEVLTRLTREAIEDAHNDGIRILELRYAPTFIAEGHPHLSFERIHRAIVAGVEQTRHLPIAVGLIVTVQRILPVTVAERVIDFAIEHSVDHSDVKNDSIGHIVGVDLADNEEGFDSQPFASCFQRAKRAGLGITIHAGEAPSPEAPERVRRAIEILGADRIGHGLQIIYSPAVIQFVRERDVTLELCPTSNWLTNAIANIEDHPLKRLKNEGVAVTVNSDDPSVFGIDLTHEYRLLANRFQMTTHEFDQMNDRAAYASFIPLAQRQRRWPRNIKNARR